MIIPYLLVKLHHSSPDTIKTVNGRDMETTETFISSLICIFSIIMLNDHVWTIYIQPTDSSSDFLDFLSRTLQIKIDWTQNSISDDQIINL